jgi:cyclopropane fatty-acyl-phospholipid synthase-like methyltransferase
MDLKNRFNAEEILQDLIQIKEGYHERPVSWFKENILSDLLKTKERLNLGENILDVGCAYGYFTKVIAENFNKVTGIDFAISRITAAKEHNLSENIEYICLDLTQDEIPGQYDSAISSAVYQHINPNNGDRIKAFEATFAVIPSGSYLICYDELFDTRPNNWDGFYEPLKKEWIQQNLSHVCKLVDAPFICRGLHGEYEYRFELQKV